MVYLFLISLITTPFFGLYVDTGLSLSISNLIGWVDSAVLVMSYFTSVAARFDKTSKQEAGDATAGDAATSEPSSGTRKDESVIEGAEEMDSGSQK